MDAEKMKEIRLGQVRWPNEIMWSDEQQAKQGWLAIVPNHELQALLDEVEALTKLLKKCRDEMAGLPHSLGYGFTHLPELDAAIARHEPKDAER